MQGFADIETRRSMVSAAMRVRKFLRIKVADCADFEFLKDNLLLILAFFQNLKNIHGTAASSLSLSKFLAVELGQPIAHKFREASDGSGVLKKGQTSIFNNDVSYFKY